MKWAHGANVIDYATKRYSEIKQTAPILERIFILELEVKKNILHQRKNGSFVVNIID